MFTVVNADGSVRTDASPADDDAVAIGDRQLLVRDAIRQGYCTRDADGQLTRTDKPAE